MDQNDIRELLLKVKDGSLEIEEAINSIRIKPFEDLGFAKIDHHRSIRKGFPEVIYCQGKTTAQIKEIVQKMAGHNNCIMATRASREVFDSVDGIESSDNIQYKCTYYDTARIILVGNKMCVQSEKTIAVLTAGTSDMPVAEEAAITAEIMGNKVERLYDVGVAGIHRLLANAPVMMRANVLIVAAGMEGALASVVGGMVDKPVIAVPTSVGYGASFGGLSALLAMLNSCASGIGVVNIDNGFGAGYLASMINHL